MVPVKIVCCQWIRTTTSLLKGMMGASFMDQIVNNYLSKNKLDEGTSKVNNTNKIVENGKTYTTMEHTWDEAYGYIYGVDGTKF
jgi:hypothetical protein